MSTVLVVLEDGLIGVPNNINITLPAEGMLLNFLFLGDEMCFQSML
jgi:hypothetical protein